MANITRIKAKDPRKPKEEKKAEKTLAKVEKKAKKAEKVKKPMPKWLKIITWPFRMIAKPFIAFGRYLRDSWREIRQVRWPNRKTTWKMVLAVFIYSALLITIIMLLDALFTWLFNIILN